MNNSKISYFSGNNQMRKAIIRNLPGKNGVSVDQQKRIEDTVRIYISNSYKFSKAPIFGAPIRKSKREKLEKLKIDRNSARKDFSTSPRNRKILQPLFPQRRNSIGFTPMADIKET